MSATRLTAALLLALTTLAILATGANAEATLVSSYRADAWPHVARASDDATWFVGETRSGTKPLALIRVSASGKKRFPLTGRRSDRFTVVGLAAGENGRIWVSLRSIRRAKRPDQLLILNTSGRIKRVPIAPSVHPRTLAHALHGRVWALGADRLMAIDPIGSVAMVDLPHSLAISQIAAGDDGAAWASGNNGIARLSASGELATRKVYVGTGGLAPAGSGAWFTGEHKFAHADDSLNVTYTPMPDRPGASEYFDDGSWVVAFAQGPGDKTSFLWGDGGIAKEYIHIARPGIGTISPSGEISEVRLPEAYNFDVRVNWLNASDHGVSMLSVGPGPLYWLGNVGPGVRSFSSG